MLNWAAYTLFAWLSSSCLSADSFEDFIERGYRNQPNISHFWGHYSPYFAVNSGIENDIPQGCQVTFAQILSRHGSRTATNHENPKQYATIRKIQQRIPHNRLIGVYSSLKILSVSTSIGTLTDFGRIELVASGIKFRRRYNRLAQLQQPFIRALNQSGTTRFQDSASDWLDGFYWGHNTNSSQQSRPHVLMLHQGEGQRNTLGNSGCPAQDDQVKSRHFLHPAQMWLRVFSPPIVDRLSRDLPEANINEQDVLVLLRLCAFETVASPTGNVSPLCELFSEEEYHCLNYYDTLVTYYKGGPGFHLGPAQGIGWVNELIARMTFQPINISMSANGTWESTLDKPPGTFPTGPDHQMFADFTHEVKMASIFFALHLFPWRPLYSFTSMREFENHYEDWFRTSLAVPFASRAYFEKMKCDTHPEELVRILVNDKVMPQPACRSDELGRCTLSNFVNGLTWARNLGNWHECFES